jgi:hypothetical protein
MEIAHIKVFLNSKMVGKAEEGDWNKKTKAVTAIIEWKNKSTRDSIPGKTVDVQFADALRGNVTLQTMEIASIDPDDKVLFGLST